MKICRILKYTMLPAILMILLFNACVEEIDRFNPIEWEIQNIDDFFDQVQSFEIDKTCNAEEGIKFITNRRTIVTIPPSSFLDASGQVVTGEIKIEFIEILDQGLMMLYKKPTISNGTLLESGGVFKITATQDGEELDFNPSSSGIVIQVPSENPNPMQLFLGEEDPAGQFNWVEASENMGWIFRSEWMVGDSTGGTQDWDFGYEILTRSLEWINCDRFISLPEDQRTSICVDLPENYTNLNTIVYVVFHDLNSVIGLAGDAQKMLFCDPYEGVPIGETVTFITISVLDEDVYHIGLAENVMIVEDLLQSIIPEEKSLEQILDILGQF